MPQARTSWTGTELVLGRGCGMNERSFGVVLHLSYPPRLGKPPGHRCYPHGLPLAGHPRNSEDGGAWVRFFALR